MAKPVDYSYSVANSSALWHTTKCDTNNYEYHKGILVNENGTAEMQSYRDKKLESSGVYVNVSGTMHCREWRGRFYSKRYMVTLAKRFLRELSLIRQG